MWIFFFWWGGHSTNHKGLLLLLRLSRKALSLLTSLTCPEAGILAGIFSMISFCIHMPSWKGGQGRAGGQEVAQFAHTPHSFSAPRPQLGPATNTGSFPVGQETGGQRAWEKVSDGQRGRRFRPGWKEQSRRGDQLRQARREKSTQ